MSWPSGIWNEPNNPDFLVQGTNRKALTSTLYGQLYSKAYSAIKTQLPSARVFIGELSYIGRRFVQPGVKRHPFIKPSQFLERSLQYIGAGAKTDGVAWHPYQVQGNPQHPNGNKGEQGIGRVATIQKELDRLYKQKVGNYHLLKTSHSANPPLYFTEFGYFNQRPKLNPTNAKKWQTEALRASWLPLALKVATKSRVRWMLLFQATEAGPADVNASTPKDDYGLFSIRGDVTGTRPYGKRGGPDGAPAPGYNYPQDRLAYCAVYRWAKVNNYSPLPSSTQGSFGPCPR